jgi:hypothetical protein
MTVITGGATMKKLSVLGIVGGAALLAAVPLSPKFSQQNVTLSLDSAEARIGRPLTPLSVAGVHRRAYRRAAYGGVAAAAVGYGVGSYYSGYSYPAYSNSYYGTGYGSYSNYSYPSYSYSNVAPSSPSWGTGYSGYSYPAYSDYRYYRRPFVGGWRAW